MRERKYRKRKKKKKKERNPGGNRRRWPTAVSSPARAARTGRGRACALCRSPWRGLGAQARLSRLVSDFLPSAPALRGRPSSPRRAPGGGGTGGGGGLAELSARTDRTLLPNPPTPPSSAASSSHHLPTLPVPKQPPAPAPCRRRTSVATAGPASGPFRALHGEAFAPCPARGEARGSRGGRWGGRLGALRRVAEPGTCRRRGEGPSVWPSAQPLVPVFRVRGLFCYFVSFYEPLYISYLKGERRLPTPPPLFDLGV